MKLTTRKSWNLDIKGIKCEISFWTNESMKSDEHRSIYPHKGIWNSYIYINKKAISRGFKKLIPEIKKSGYGLKQNFAYYDLPVSMAYGLTFFDVSRKPDGEIFGVKIGNDYNHIWNKDQYIDEKTIKKDLEEAVEGIIKLFPNYKVWSHVTGKYVKPEELEEYNKKEHKRIFKK